MSNSSEPTLNTSVVGSKKSNQIRILSWAVLLLVGALVVVEIYMPHLSVRTLLRDKTENQATAIAVVVQTTADVRQKPEALDEWFRAEPEGDVVTGDAIYSGSDSSAEIKMKSGAEISLQDEVLVIFDGENQISIPDEARGMIRLQLEPGSKLSFSGQVSANSSGDGIVSAANGMAVVKVQRGTARISEKNGGFRKFERGQSLELKIKASEAKNLSESVSSKSLSKSRGQSVATLAKIPQQPVPAEALVKPAPPPVATPVAVPAEMPVQKQMDQPVVALPPILEKTDYAYKHTWLLRERYQRKGKQSLEVRSLPRGTRARISLSWQDSTSRLPGQDAYIQVSNSVDFSKPWLEAISKSATLDHGFWPLGESYWRVSYDKINWSPPGKVLLSADFDLKRRPTISSRYSVLTLPHKKPSKRNAKRQKTASGQPVALDLLFGDASGQQDSPVAWVLQATESENFLPQLTKTILVPNKKITIPLKRIGRYFFRVQTVSKQGKLSAFSATKTIAVVAPKPRKPEPVILRIAETEQVVKEPEVRQIAAIEKQAVTAEGALQREAKIKTVLESRDERYYTGRKRNWHIGFEAGLFAAAIDGGSSAAGSSGDSPPAGPIVGFNGGYDNGRHSARVSFRKETAINRPQVSGDDLAASRFDVRYENWLNYSTSIFKRPMRYGLLGGYSHYRVPRSAVVTQPFDLMKLGLAIEFEVLESWRTGGDFIVGKWIDSNQTFEANGFLNYDYSKVFGIGLGYRLNMYEAGPSSDAGLGIPYRGIVGEAYSGFRYSF